MADAADSFANTRRVVTGIGPDGRSRVIIDGPIPQMNTMSAALAWRCAVPADNTGSDDTVVPYAIEALHSGEANFAVCEFAPHCDALMHATDTIDYLVVLSGAVTLVLEEGEAALGPGDFVVDRGVVHGWRNDGDVPCRCAVVNLPARPVGGGRTI
jgi:quercetin dioxygenase-like cupin family protein